MLSNRVHVDLNPPHLDDNRADCERLLDRLSSFGVVGVPLKLLRRMPRVLRQADWRLTVTLGRTDRGWKVQALEPAGATGRQFGLAVDAGTTTITASVVDLVSGRTLATAAGENAQTVVGEDVLTRIHAAWEPGGLEKLQGLLVGSVNRVAGEAASAAQVALEEITAAAVGANTVMTHFFLGLDPTWICREPYVPVVNRPGIVDAAGLGMAVHSEAVVYCLPGVGSYFGGDAVAGIMVSGMHEGEEISLFMDIGTNGEMVVGNREWLVAAAGAAGPAFEGGVVRHGVRAGPGAVERVRVDPRSHRVEYKVIGGGKAKGLCGSAVVDALAGMLLAGIVDRAGRFRDGRETFVIVPGIDADSGEDIVITRQDIKNFLRTKGAVNAAMETLLAAVGVKPQEVSRFYVAGAFGERLDVEAAVTIGLYPDLPRERIRLLGNSSLEGARQALVSEEKRRELEEICRRITYLELNVNTDFMARFAGSQFFPHTDIALYPSVERRLRAAGLLHHFTASD